MPVIWGLDLKEIQWGKFKGNNMWNNAYHLRRTKFIIYQAAMILCVVSESLGTDALSKYVDQQKDVAKADSKAYVYNNDYVGIASFNIFVGVYVATIFGAAFFFDLFWPERHESKGVRLAWKVNALLCPIFVLADAIAYTVIVCTHNAHVSGVSSERAQEVLSSSGGPPITYHENGRVVASLVLLWLGFPFVIASTILLFMSHKHDDQLGPKSTHARNDVETRAGEMGAGMADKESTDDPAWHAARIQQGKETTEGSADAQNRRSGLTEEAAPAI